MWADINNAIEMETVADPGQEYFTSYEDLEVHELMLRDVPRQDAYKNAIFSNKDLFKASLFRKTSNLSPVKGHLYFRTKSSWMLVLELAFCPYSVRKQVRNGFLL